VEKCVENRKKDIRDAGFPLPDRDMLPVSVEEKLVCYADKFYSKSENHLLTAKPVEKVLRKVAKYGEDKKQRFEEMMELFGVEFYEHLV